jgi:arylsulfatase B
MIALLACFVVGIHHFTTTAATSSLPNIVILVGDDVGWTGVSYHNTTQGGDKEIRTPHLDHLAATGIELDQHYVYRFCSPSRSSFQSGRLPVHVNVENVAPEVHNASDNVGGYQGIAKTMTGLATKMSSAGYQTHMVGKWDAGMATPDHTPIGRGYTSWLGYFHHANDYYTEGLPLKAIGKINVCFNQYTDLWGPTQAPAAQYVGTGAYEEDIFTNRTLHVIGAHNASEGPLFLVHAFHLVHTPLEVPVEYLNRFDFIDNAQRQHYAAMTSYMDVSVGTIIQAIQAKEQMYENTLVLFFADNGGAIYNVAGGNNYPLKGGKMSDWQGGIRGTAFVSGGYVPHAKRGTTLTALLHVSDWYRTFASIAGVDPTDHTSGPSLPVVDGIDLTSLLFGNNSRGTASESRELHISEQTLIRGNYKLITGIQAMTGWTGPQYPNNTGPMPTYIPLTWTHDCKDGELYDIMADPTEHHNIASMHPTVVVSMQKRLIELNQRNYMPARGFPDPKACVQAKKMGGFYGPWLDLKTERGYRYGNDTTE